MEKGRQQYRFEWKINEGKTERKQVKETRPSNAQKRLFDMNEETLQKLTAEPKASAAVKEASGKALTSAKKLNGMTAEAMKIDESWHKTKLELERITVTLGKLPAGSKAHQTYLKKFQTADALADKLKAQSKEKATSLATALKEYRTLVESLNAK